MNCSANRADSFDREINSENSQNNDFLILVCSLLKLKLFEKFLLGYERFIIFLRLHISLFQKVGFQSQSIIFGFEPQWSKDYWLDWIVDGIQINWQCFCHIFVCVRVCLLVYTLHAVYIVPCFFTCHDNEPHFNSCAIPVVI